MDSKWSSWYWLLIIVIGLSAFAQILYFDFAWFDFHQIVNGNLIAENFSELWSFYINDDQYFESSHRPIFNTFLSLDHWIWGIEPFGFHLSSIIIHVINALLLYQLLALYGIARTRVLLITMLWLVLPIHAYGVGLIIGKSELLGTFFVLLSVLVYLRRNDNVINLIASGFLFFLALLSSETSFALPIFVLALHLVKLRKSTLVEFMAFVPGLVMVVLLRTFTTSWPDVALGEWMMRIATFPKVYGEYFWCCIPSIHLSAADTVFSFSMASMWSNVLGYGLFSFAIISQIVLWKKVPNSRVAILWFNAFLLPFSQVVPTSLFRAEHFLYLPSVGWVGMLYLALTKWMQSEKLMMLIMVLFIVFAVVRLNIHLPQVSNDDAIWNAAFEAEPECRLALAYQGKSNANNKNYDAAELFLRSALTKRDGIFSFLDEKQTKFDYATVWFEQGNWTKAMEIYESIYEDYSYVPGLYLNLGICYKNLGKANEALRFLSLYQKDHPDELLGMEKIAEVYIDLGYKQKAIDEFNKILRLYPNHQYRVNILDAIETLQNLK